MQKNPKHLRVRRKFYESVRRYLPAEIAGTLGAFIGFWLCMRMTGSLATAAFVASLSESVSYYAVIYASQLRSNRKLHATMRWHTSTAYNIRDILLEFGPAEIIDTFAVRPALFYILPLWLDGARGLAVILAKFLSDIVFYALAMSGHEIRKKLFPIKQPVEQQESAS